MSKATRRPARFKVRVLLSWNNAKGDQTPYGEGTPGLPRQPSHRRGPACHQTNVYCSFGPEKSRFGKELSGEHRLWQESDTRMDQPRRCFLSGRVLLGLPVRVAVFRFRRHGDLFRTFFEHLGAETEARAFLLECLRCLQSQGVMRLVVPDAWAYLRAYSGRRQCHRWLPSSVPGAKKMRNTFSAQL